MISLQGPGSNNIIEGIPGQKEKSWDKQAGRVPQSYSLQTYHQSYVTSQPLSRPYALEFSEPLL